MPVPRQAPYVICYLCGRKYGTKSITIHEPQCQQKWLAENKKLPKHLRRKMPTKPDYGQLTSGDYNQNILDQMNELSFKAAQDQLIPCGNCGRTFLPDRLPIHQKSCTTEKSAHRRANFKPHTENVNFVEKNRNKVGPTEKSDYDKNQQNDQLPQNQSVKPSKRQKSVTNNSKHDLIPCMLCHKNVPVNEIQTHLLRCNEEKSKHLLTQQNKEKTFEKTAQPDRKQSVERPRTRVLHRGPPQPFGNIVESKKTNGKNYDTYDIDSDEDFNNRKPIKNSTYNIESDQDMNEAASNLTPCDICNRKFASDRINKHRVICMKTKSKVRKTFNSSKQRFECTENQPSKKAIHTTKAQPKSNWRQTHEDFIRSIRSAKKVTAHMAKGGKASDLPPPPPSLNPDYVHCQYCDRKFNPEVAQRHIPKCATTINRPKPPKEKALDRYKTVPVKKQLKKEPVSQSGRASRNRAFENEIKSFNSQANGSILRQNKRQPSSEHFQSNTNRKQLGMSHNAAYISPRSQNRYDEYHSPDFNYNNNNQKQNPSRTKQQENFDPYKPKTFSGINSRQIPSRGGYSYNAMNQSNPSNYFGGY